MIRPLSSHRMSSRLRFALLAAILTLAAALRFAGLSAGLRHTTFIDEQFFVVNVEGMLDRGDLDHRYHEYPGFFFYLLTPALAFVKRPFGAEAYLVARQVVAALGVGTVALVYVLGVRLAGARAGLIGATVLAVSPVAVAVAHEVRPDVALGLFAMVALLIIERVDGGWKRDVLSGVGVGMATAIKFTGVTLALPYVVARLTVPEKRVKGMLLAGAFSLVAYALLSPYSFLHFNDFMAGIQSQKDYHDLVPERGAQGYWAMVFVYLGSVLPIGLGVPATLAAFGGLWAGRRDWRRLLPLMALPLGLIAVLSTAQIHRTRFLLPALGAVAVLAAIGVDAVWKRSRIVGVTAFLVIIGAPLVGTTQSVAAFLRPNTMDRVLDWTAENLPEGSRIASAFPRLGFGVGRFDVVSVEDWATLGPRIAAHADVVISVAAENTQPLPGFVRRFVALPAHPLEGPPIEVLSRVAPKIATTPVDLRHARIDASEDSAQAPLIADGDLATRWETRETQRPGMWVSVDFLNPRTIERVELALGRRPNQWGRSLGVEVSGNGRDWTRVKTTPGRAMVPDQVTGDRGHVQVLLLVTPTLASAVRIVVTDPGDARWGIAELEIHALPESPEASNQSASPPQGPALPAPDRPPTKPTSRIRD